MESTWHTARLRMQRLILLKQCELLGCRWLLVLSFPLLRGHTTGKRTRVDRAISADAPARRLRDLEGHPVDGFTRGFVRVYLCKSHCLRACIASAVRNPCAPSEAIGFLSPARSHFDKQLRQKPLKFMMSMFWTSWRACAACTRRREYAILVCERAPRAAARLHAATCATRRT